MIFMVEQDNSAAITAKRSERTFKMAQVIMEMDEYKQFEEAKNNIRTLKRKVRNLQIFEYNDSDWNTAKDVIRALTLEETKALVDYILNMR